MPIDFDTANFDFRVIADSFNPTPLFVQGYAFYGTYYNMTFDKRLIPAGENSIIYINWSTTPLITRALGGVAPGADIFAYKVLDSGGVGYFSDIIKAIDDSVDLDGDGIPAEDDEDMVDIISMSLGGMGSPDSPESEAISNVFEAGVVVVVAAGNSGPYHFSVGSPGSSDKALTVGAVYKKDYVGDYWGDIDPRRDQITSFSSRGPVASGAVKPDVVAPGAIICSAEYDSAWSDRRCYDGAHVEISGTSMATPHVAGLAALAKQAHPSWSPQDIKNTIRATAIDLGDWTTDQGLGRVDAFGSVQTTPPFPTAIIDSSYQNLDLLQDNQFEVEGTAEGLLFDSYALSYADGIDSEDWIPVYSSTSPVINGVLGHISANVTEGVIKVKLTVQDQTGQESSDTAIRIQRDDFDVSAHPGWPRQLHKDLFEGFMFVGAIFACANNGIKVADLDGDGRNEIITTNMGSPGKLYVFRDDGTLFWQKNSTSFVCSTPAIGNIDADPELEIMYKANFPLWDDSLGFSDHVIQAWNHDGSVVPGWPVDTLGEIAPLDSPSLADMDNDGIDEIIVQRSRKLEVIDGKGSTIWAVGNDQGFAMGAPVVVDLNHDGKIDVLQSNIVDQIYAYDNGGDELWRVTGCNPPVQGTLAAAKTKDGRVFISAGTCILNSTGNILFNTFGQTIFGNIDTDTDPEIVSYDWGRIATYELDGTKIGEYLIPLGDWLNPVSPLSYQPVIGDMDNDGLNDIVSFSRTGNILIFNASANLTQVIKSFNNLDLISVSVESAYPSLYDIDNDGKLELLHIMEFEAGSYLFVSNIPGSGNHVEWGTYQHDNKNTGCYNCVLSCRPGQIIGDVDDDGSVTAEDQNLVGNVVAGTIQPPSNICCIDATQDREVNVGDITRIGRIATGLDPSPGVCENVLNCHVGQLIGDLNGNGEVTKDDQFLAAELVAGNIPLPDDICCADANIDRKISVGDVTKIGRIVAGLDPSTGLCS
ncbi:MAG TPA: S8 family serine peptidase [Candidatus Nanoarchaeia archaeon]|nr:S8 family serine peptidase [Candidatus Nanoarchaeia archaeon]